MHPHLQVVCMHYSCMTQPTWQLGAWEQGSAAQVTVGVGYIGHFLLTQLLLDKLKDSAPARIVWVTASAKIKASLDWDDLG